MEKVCEWESRKWVVYLSLSTLTLHITTFISFIFQLHVRKQGKKKKSFSCDKILNEVHKVKLLFLICSLFSWCKAILSISMWLDLCFCDINKLNDCLVQIREKTFFFSYYIIFFIGITSVLSSVVTCTLHRQKQ